MLLFGILIIFVSFSLGQRMTTYKRVKPKRERPGTHYALAPHLDYDDSVYNPRPAFVPYWPVGEWVYEESYSTFYTTTSTKPPMVVGRPCPKHYRHIKQVCAHKMKRWWKDMGCETYYFHDRYRSCRAETMDFEYAYHTFPTFCQFLEFNQRYGIYLRFIFVHIGPCVNDFPLFHPYNPLFYKEFIPLRFEHFMDKLNRTFFNVTTEEDLTVAPPTDIVVDFDK